MDRFLQSYGQALANSETLRVRATLPLSSALTGVECMPSLGTSFGVSLSVLQSHQLGARGANDFGSLDGLGHLRFPESHRSVFRAVAVASQSVEAFQGSISTTGPDVRVERDQRARVCRLSSGVGWGNRHPPMLWVG